MKKILIVDDEPNIIMSLEYALQKNGFEVFVARDGQEALDILKKHIPDLVLLDIMMPNVDGFETLRKIRENEKLNAVQVVFLSAKNKTTDIEKGLQLGAASYVTKPFSLKKMIAEINELLN